MRDFEPLELVWFNMVVKSKDKENTCSNMYILSNRDNEFFWDEFEHKEKPKVVIKR